MCEICWKLTLKAPEQRSWRCFDIFIFNFEQISVIASILNFEHVTTAGKNGLFPFNSILCFTREENYFQYPDNTGCDVLFCL